MVNFRSNTKVSFRTDGCEGSHISSCKKPFAGMYCMYCIVYEIEMKLGTIANEEFRRKWCSEWMNMNVWEWIVVVIK